MTDGVISVAKAPGDLDLAEWSARSLRCVNLGLAVDFFTDQLVTPGPFDQVGPIPDGPTPRPACLTDARSDQTLYLDCDTVMLASPDDLFDMPGRNELAIAMSHAASQAADVSETVA